MWDLSCELLAVAASLPSPPEPAVLEDAWQRVAAAQHACGAIPEEGSAQDAAPPGQDDPYAFTDCYHSTLMAVFAAALTTARPREAEHAGQGVPG